MSEFIQIYTLYLLVHITLSTKKQSEGSSSPAVSQVGSLRFSLVIRVAEIDGDSTSADD